MVQNVRFLQEHYVFHPPRKELMLMVSLENVREQMNHTSPDDKKAVTILPEHIREVLAKATCLYSKTAVNAALDKMAAEISAELSLANPLFLCVVIGGIVPLGNLLPRLDFPLEVDYIHATRYQNKIVGSEIAWKALPKCSLKNRTVVIVDDVLDGGITLAEIVKYCQSEGAREVLTAVL